MTILLIVAILTPLLLIDTKYFTEKPRRK